MEVIKVRHVVNLNKITNANSEGGSISFDQGELKHRFSAYFKALLNMDFAPSLKFD